MSERVKGKKMWEEAFRRFVIEFKAGTVHTAPGEAQVIAEESGACDQVCRDHGGVDLCGQTFAVCNDGEVFLLNP